MTVSSNTILHYTSKRGLFNILRDGFYPSYCKETITALNFKQSFAVPMVSFCDIPLSMATQQTKKYGKYAIGLSVEWAKRNRLNPVQYVEENSNLGEGLAKLVEFIHLDWSGILTDDKIWNEFYDGPYQGAVSVLKSLKNYSGILDRKGNKKMYKFYDEREWRYSPVITVEDEYNHHLHNIYHGPEYEKLKIFPKKPHFKTYGLSFNSKDIKYIIVKNQNEVEGLIKYLKRQTYLFENNTDFEILITKILNFEHIEEDF